MKNFFYLILIIVIIFTVISCTENTDETDEPSRSTKEAGQYIKHWSYDKHEDYLTEFDKRGIMVYLQVESGLADMEELIDLIFNRYKHHPSVIGFGVDVEWYKAKSYNDMNNGQTRVEKEDAEKWMNKLRTYNPEYRMFLKHWERRVMPKDVDGLIYVNDSQDFPEYHNCDNSDDCMSAMVDEFATKWASYFYPSPVHFQVGYGYKRYDSEKDEYTYYGDMQWWKDLLPNPILAIGESISNAMPSDQECGIYWVDFTYYDVVGKYSISKDVKNSVAYAGFRSSNYGFDDFPEPSEWADAILEFSDHYEYNGKKPVPTGIWIIGTIDRIGNCTLEFPKL